MSCWVSIALTAATVCTAHVFTKRLDETQWPDTRDETYWAETETYCPETRPPETHRSFLNFCEIPWNSAEISKFHEQGQIPRPGSKFHGLRKTVGPTDEFISIITTLHHTFCHMQSFGQI